MATGIQITTGDASILVTLSDGSTILVDPNTEKTFEMADEISATVAVRSDEPLPEIKGRLDAILGSMGGQEEGSDGLR